MDHFNTAFDEDEYEDVPSPFATKTATRTRSRDNLFSRPIGTVPSEAPTIVEAVRRAPTSGQTDFLAPKKRQARAPEVEYLDEEDEDEETTALTVPERKSSPRKKTKAKTDLLPRVGWIIMGVLLLRLVFMERGVLEYWKMDSTLQEKQAEKNRIHAENREIQQEVQRISLDKSYQRQLAKEHLGVIAADEFLILFAGEPAENETVADRQL